MFEHPGSGTTYADAVGETLFVASRGALWAWKRGALPRSVRPSEGWATPLFDGMWDAESGNGRELLKVREDGSIAILGRAPRRDTRLKVERLGGGLFCVHWSDAPAPSAAGFPVVLAGGTEIRAPDGAILASFPGFGGAMVRRGAGLLSLDEVDEETGERVPITVRGADFRIASRSAERLSGAREESSFLLVTGKVACIRRRGPTPRIEVWRIDAAPVALESCVEGDDGRVTRVGFCFAREGQVRFQRPGSPPIWEYPGTALPTGSPSRFVLWNGRTLAGVDADCGEITSTLELPGKAQRPEACAAHGGLYAVAGAWLGFFPFGNDAATRLALPFACRPVRAGHGERVLLQADDERDRYLLVARGPRIEGEVKGMDHALSEGDFGPVFVSDERWAAVAWPRRLA